MKWYNHRAHIQHLKDIKVQRDTHLGKIIPHVNQIANTFSRDAIAIGVLNLQDLIQAGYLGLLEAWDKVDWTKIDQSTNPDAQLWSFLKKRIRWAIRREIDRYGQHISTPINKLEEARNKYNFKGLDRVLVNVFPKFFNDEAIHVIDPGPYISVQLEEIIEDELYKVERSADNRHILLAFYGIGIDRKNQKELAEIYRKPQGSIQKIIERTRNKLKTEEFKLIIENFYKN